MIKSALNFKADFFLLKLIDLKSGSIKFSLF